MQSYLAAESGQREIEREGPTISTDVRVQALASTQEHERCDCFNMKAKVHSSSQRVCLCSFV